MSKFSKETEVLVGSKQLKIEEILKSIIYLPAEQVLEFLKDIGLTVPRELRIYVLRENLRAKVAETRKTRLTLADELNYRLSWFTEFTETQLENLLIFFDDKEIIKQYLEDLWTDLFGYMVEKQVPDFDLDRLYQSSIEHVKANGLTLPNIAEYNYALKDVFYDSFGRIDGVSPNKIRNVLYKSSTLSEIRDLGKKYDVNIPRRLKKNQLADIIVNELKDNGEYTEDLEKQVRSMSVIIMQRFAIDHDIKASTELKKEEVIEYILKNAKETKETYFIPNSRDVYEKEMDDEPVEEEVLVAAAEEEKPQEEEKPAEEVVEEAPVEEEPVDEGPQEVVEEEPKVEEEVSHVETKVVEVIKEVPAKVEYVAPAINLDALVEEVKKLREAITVAAKPQEVVKQEQKAVEAPEKEVVDAEFQTKPKVSMINSAEFYGSQKSYKQIVKNDEAKEREAFVEQHKAEVEAAKQNKDPKDDPIELRAIKATGKKLYRILKYILLKVVLRILLPLTVVLLAGAVYGYHTHPFGILKPVFDFLNDTFTNNGEGILDIISGWIWPSA